VIISRTPYRISFFGGGTDYPEWYKEHGGAVLSTTIDKYCHISCRYLPPFFEHNSRVVYSKIELVNKTSEIQHPAVRAALEFMRFKDGIEIHHDGDLPARTGIGSSSSFTVGLIHALYAMKKTMATKKQLALDAIEVERDILNENVGSQDQVAAAMGGLNRISFERNGHFKLEPIIMDRERLMAFQSHMMLFFTGFSRYATEIAKKQIENTKKKAASLKRMRTMVDQGVDLLIGDGPLSAFGEMLHEGWHIKRDLADGITTPAIDAIYEKGCSAGAIGGKLIGAGGGGFMLFFVKPEDQPKVREALKDFLLVPFRFEHSGSQIIFYRPNNRETDYPQDRKG